MAVSVSQPEAVEIPESEGIALSILAPKPITLAETGLSVQLLDDLILKHLYVGGVLDLLQLAERMALAGSLLEERLAFLREEGRVEVRGHSPDKPALRYALTERGRAGAAEAVLRDGYIGPAPVTLSDYRTLVARQSVHKNRISRERVHTAFSDTVIRTSLLDTLGPALISGKAMFIYGDAGTGKSFICRRLSRLLQNTILVPHAITANDSVIQYFDPAYHNPVEVEHPKERGLVEMSSGHDPRFKLCQRPVVITGGELTMDMLELQFDSATRRYRAPLQFLANNGMMVIDDLGRQRVAPVDLFNRWIVPLEERHDSLILQSGLHIEVPFDVVLAFSTNLDPLQLADEAFLRRIGYKIHFEPLHRDEYTAIWRQHCSKNGVAVDDTLLDYLFENLYEKSSIPLLACHPRDLIDLALDYGRYQDRDGLSEDALRWAWSSYFVRLT